MLWLSGIVFKRRLSRWWRSNNLYLHTSLPLSYCNFLAFHNWGLTIPHGAFSKIEKDNDLASFIQTNKVGYAKAFKLMWDVHNFATMSSKAKHVKEFDALVKFHEFEMIHGMYVLR
jgi:hypothetical protein